MWREVAADDQGLAQRCIEIMHGVDRAYKKLGHAFVTARIKTENATILYYEEGENEGVMMLQPNRRLGLYRIYTAGYRGPAQPSAIARIFAERIVQFMRERGLATVYAIRRLGLDNPQMNAALDALPDAPSIRVTIDHEMRDRTVWKISAA